MTPADLAREIECLCAEKQERLLIDMEAGKPIDLSTFYHPTWASLCQVLEDLHATETLEPKP
ncbi:hypothetical protein [Mesorhizobium sp. M0494]|uniref:hypothetical protein n=1 Tax=unclassified Mesorhizobium TaxID=325217 RepID=UPI00333D24FF